MPVTEWIPLDRLWSKSLPGRLLGASDGQRTTHDVFRQQVLDWHAAFTVAPGRDWALYFDDALAFSAALFGAWHAGKRVWLAPDNLPATLDALQSHVTGFVGDVGAPYPSLAASVGSVDVDLPALDARACELVVFTSGSTGEPSAINKRLDQLACEVDALQAAFGAGIDGARIHGTVSHQHIYGLLFRVLWPLAAGRPIQPRCFFHEDLVRVLAEADAVLVATPAHLKRLPAQLDWAGVHGHLRAVFSSGGPLPVEAAIQVRQLLGVAATEVYGSSETGGIAWRRWYDTAPAWQALPGVQWRVEDGCLEVASGHLETTDWWRTQDRVQALDDGCFRLLGRADRIVKVEERRVSLDALERALCADPQVAEAQVFMLAGAREQLAAVVVPADPALVGADEAERRTFFRRLGAVLARSHDAVVRPRRWRLVTAMPLNAQGKVPHAALEALFRPLMPVPQWMQKSHDSALLQLVLDPALRVFDGHFPQARILPGVAQLDWAVGYGRQAFAIPLHFVRMDVVKFQQVARPGDVLALQLDWDAPQGMLAFRYTSGHGVHASGKIIFAEA